MKVLHVIPSAAAATGGPVQSLLGWCRAMPRSISVTVAATDEGLSSREALALRHALDPAGLHLFGHVGRHTTSLSLPMLRWLRANAGQFDVVHVHALLHPMSSLAARIANRAGVPTVLRPLGTLSGYTFAHRRGWLKRRYLQFVDAPALARATAVHFTSEVERRRALTLCDIPRPVVITAPFDASRITVAPDRRRDPATVLCLSRIDPVKGLECLVEAFALLRLRTPQARLVIAGSGDADYTAGLRASATARGLDGAIEYPGFVTGAAKRALLARATVFALPSRSESFSMATVEAMAHGLMPVISGEVAIAPDVAARRAGIVTQRTPEAVCAALLEAISRPERRREMALRAREMIETLYAPAAVGEQLAALYRAVATARS